MSEQFAMAHTTVVSPGVGQVIHAFGAEMIFHLTGKETEGRQMLATIIAPPGQAPPLHYHEEEDETFYVLEGRMSFYVDGQWGEVPPGTVVFAPKGSVHSLKNVGDTPSRVLTVAAPSGFEIFFARCAEEFAKPGGPDMARIVEISAEHGIRYV